MDGSDWFAAAAAFIGGLTGAGLSTWVALRGQRQTEREEWYRRFLAAVEQLTDPSPDRHRIGEDMLAELVESDLGTPEERALAERILRGQLEPDVQKVVAFLHGASLDQVRVEEDNEHRSDEEAVDEQHDR
ncbi:hypothetical protein [Luteipulveratus mongoliensis]|uniref:hypothetical protein n=1 Tax=Luteipulveratus mongoliensis TaxID=571913 RepID=UPI0012EECD75|nr:hypothetical protein [Luteipulveratus mongoliensis]